MRIATALFLFLAAVSLCRGALAFPRVEAGNTYQGTVTENDMECSVNLDLMGSGFFALRQSSKTDEKVTTQTITGRWRQTGDGAQLRLANQYGFSQRLNVGGSGLLYGDFTFSRSAPSVSLALKKKQFMPEPFLMMGLLQQSQAGTPVLLDCAAQITFPVVPGSMLPEQPDGAPLFVEALVSMTSRGLRIEKIVTATRNIPKSSMDVPESRNFGDITHNSLWVLPLKNNAIKTAWFFSRIDAQSGRAEITAPGLHIMATYTDMGRGRIEFAVTEEDSRMLHALGETELLNLLTNTNAWALDEDDLLLYGRHETIVSLTRASAHDLAR